MLKRLIYLSLTLSFLLLFSCSTQKNTPITRAFHNLTAHYNVFFNARMALEDANKQITDQCQINYFNLLPVFPYECPNASSLAKAKLNRVLEKSAKTIRKHSITVKPQMRGNNLSPAQRAFLKRKEYNKWVDDSYLLIGIANLYKGDIAKSQRALHKILDDFKEQNTRFDAQLWLVRSYISQGRYLDAKKSLQELEADPRHPRRLNKEIFLTWADIYIHLKQYDKAISYLEKALKLLHDRQQKAKYTYLLAQLYLMKGDKQQASVLFKKVPHYNPPYELEFHSQLMRATTLSSSQGTRQIRRKLMKMLRDEKNEEFKDKIYYALGQTYLQNKDTAQALKYFRMGAALSQDNLNKALIYNQIADLYFSTRNYILSGAYYDSTLRFLPQNYDNYEKIKRKSANLIELAKNYQIIQTQDSLLRLASLPQKKLNSIIDSIIQARKKQKEQSTGRPTYDPFDIESQRYASGLPTTQSQGGKWYFYNPVLVSRGQQLFRQRWGNRRLEDNWRRKNKSIISGNIENEQVAQQQQKQKTETREYYLKQIPLSDSAKQVANEKILEAWFNIAQIFENNMQNLPEAEHTYQKILQKYPDNKYLPDIYYHLYLITTMQGEKDKANLYKARLLRQFPKSRYARLLLSPTLTYQLKEKQDRAEHLLLNTIRLYNQYQYRQIIDSVNFALENLQGTSAIPNLLFLKAKAFGGLGMRDSLTSTLEYIITNYPDADITQKAKQLYNSLTKGSLNINIYKFSPQSPHYLVVFTKPQDNVNELKFTLFKLVNEYFKDQEFQVKIILLDKKRILVTRQFKDLSQAAVFLRYLRTQTMFQTKTIFLFSDQNFKTFIKDKNLFKYQLFYAKYYNF